MENFETVLILSAMAENYRDKLEERFRSFIKNIYKYEDKGIKKLAYLIQNEEFGYYIIIKYKTANNELSLIENNFRKYNDILKFITIKEEKQNECKYNRENDSL